MGGGIAICIASGHSLTQEDVDYCRGKGRVYVVNDTHMLCPWADVLYGADAQWWDYHEGVTYFKGERWTCTELTALKYNINHIPYKAQEKWSNSPNWIATGGNSGFQIVNLAEIQGATKIILLGYDMGFTNKKHFFGDHPTVINTTSRYEQWIKRFNDAKPFIKAEVINCTPNSNLTCFPMMDLRDAI